MTEVLSHPRPPFFFAHAGFSQLMGSDNLQHLGALPSTHTALPALHRRRQLGLPVGVQKFTPVGVGLGLVGVKRPHHLNFFIRPGLLAQLSVRRCNVMWLNS